jgi:hypothetical protein
MGILGLVDPDNDDIWSTAVLPSRQSRSAGGHH